MSMYWKATEKCSAVTFLSFNLPVAYSWVTLYTCIFSTYFGSGELGYSSVVGHLLSMQKLLFSISGISNNPRSAAHLKSWKAFQVNIESVLSHCRDGKVEPPGQAEWPWDSLDFPHLSFLEQRHFFRTYPRQYRRYV